MNHCALLPEPVRGQMNGNLLSKQVSVNSVPNQTLPFYLTRSSANAEGLRVTLLVNSCHVSRARFRIAKVTFKVTGNGAIR